MIKGRQRGTAHTTAIITVVCLLLAAGAAAAASKSPPLSLIIDGKAVTGPPAPRIIAGVTYAPLRSVARPLGITVDWHAKEKRAALCRGKWCMVIFAGSKPEDGRIIGGRMFVPVRRLATAVGAKVDYDAAKRRVVITSPPKKPGWLNP